MNNFDFHIDVNAFVESLGYMAKGMVGIFIVTAVIVLSMVLLNKFTSKKADK